MRRPVIIFAAVGLAVVIALLTCVDVIPKSAITPTNIEETAVRIGIYYRQNKRLPPDLSVLPVRQNYANRSWDAWNRPLCYVVDSQTSFTLSSLGRDGQPGGSGEDADISRTFYITNGQIQDFPPTTATSTRP